MGGPNQQGGAAAAAAAAIYPQRRAAGLLAQRERERPASEVYSGRYPSSCASVVCSLFFVLLLYSIVRCY